MRLSVLDQSPIAEGGSRADALAHTLDLARTADRLGYHRFWVAEHHGPNLAGASPEVLIGPLALATRHLRVGSGGVMLPHYSPLKVAESFAILDGLAPGRIDLGLGRAPGTDGMTAYALQRDRSQRAPDDFPQQLVELLAHLGRRPYPPQHPFAHLRVLEGADGPEPWLLGSSPQSAIWAGELGLPYAFADFINQDGTEIARLYRERFVPSERLPTPRLLVTMWALAADDEQEAIRFVGPSRMMFAALRRGRAIPVPTVETAARFLAHEGMGAPGRRTIVGTPERVRAGLEERATAYVADEVMAVAITHGHEERRRSYELLADAWGLTPPADGVDATPAAAGTAS